jgi:hypothetical protein
MADKAKEKVESSDDEEEPKLEIKEGKKKL